MAKTPWAEPTTMTLALTRSDSVNKVASRSLVKRPT